MHGTIKPSNHATSSKTYVDAMAHINDAVDGFMETGMALIQDIDFSGVDDSDRNAKHKHYRNNRMTVSSPHLVRSFVKQIAKDLARPIITAELDGWSGDRAHVTVRKLKRNIPIVAPFLITMDADRGPVRMRADTRNWYVTFTDPKGRVAFDRWRKECQSDPAYRKAMKLPPLPPTQRGNHDT